MWNKTRITQQFKIQYPIIQGPFGGSYSSAKLVSSVSNLGGLGSFGLNSYDSDGIVEVDKSIKYLTNKPYALNLWIPFSKDTTANYTLDDFERLKTLFRPHFKALDLSMPDLPTFKTQDFERQIETILKLKPPVVSFIFGVPSKEIIKALNVQNIQTVGTATTLEEAQCIEEAGLDVVVASGMEAGGHRASFLGKPEKTLTKTAILVERIVPKIQIPVIAAGGISNGKDIVKMLRLGASGVQMGTAFLATEASNASEQHKKLLLSKTLLKTTLTKVFTGRLARAIENRWSANFTGKEEIAPYPIQSLFLSPLRKKALEENLLDYLPFWSGQPSSILQYGTVEGLFDALLKEVNNILKI